MPQTRDGSALLGPVGTDDTDMVQAALNAGAGRSVHLSAGRYRLTRPLSVPRDTTVTGDGSGATVLDWSTSETWTNTPGSAFLEWEPGAIVTTSPLVGDVAKGQGAVTVADGSLFAAGDTVRLTSADVDFGEAVRAEFHRVVQVEGNTLVLSSSTFDAYTAACAGEVELVDLATGALSGVTIRGKGINPDTTGDNGVFFRFARDVRVSDVRFVDVENICTRFSSVLGLTVSDCAFTFAPERILLQYGVALTGATQLASIRGCNSWNDRHMVTTSTSGSTSETWRHMRGIPRHITVTGCTAHGSWQDPVDTHKGGEYITVTGNALTTEAVGVKCRGTHMVVAGNTITGKTDSPYNTASAGVRVLERCEDVRVTGNHIQGFKNGVVFEMPPERSRALVVSENTITGCDVGVSVSTPSTLHDLRVAGNHITVNDGGTPIQVYSSLMDVTITGNTLVGGVEAIKATVSSRQTMVGGLIQGNTMREQSSHGMSLRNMTDFLITGNTARNIGGDGARFAGNNTRVYMQSNMLTVGDYSTTRDNVHIDALG